jgi:hypothetical protein
MGKAAKNKLIRRMAAQMPALNIGRYVVELLSGEQLTQRGYSEEVDKQAMYKHRTHMPVPANHITKMKRLYNKHGKMGLMAYAKAVENEEKKIHDSKAISVPIHDTAG